MKKTLNLVAVISINMSGLVYAESESSNYPDNPNVIESSQENHKIYVKDGLTVLLGSDMINEHIVLDGNLNDSTFTIVNNNKEPANIIIEDSSSSLKLETIDEDGSFSYIYKNNQFSVKGNTLFTFDNKKFTNADIKSRLKLLGINNRDDYPISKSGPVNPSVTFDRNFVDTYIFKKYQNYPILIVDNTVKITYNQVIDMIKELNNYQTYNIDVVDIKTILDILKTKMKTDDYQKAYDFAIQTFHIKSDAK